MIHQMIVLLFRLQKWSGLMNLSKWKCEILCLGTRANTMCSIMHYGQLESNLMEKDLGKNTYVATLLQDSSGYILTERFPELT